jgi:hypothetical protein
MQDKLSANDLKQLIALFEVLAEIERSTEQNEE